MLIVCDAYQGTTHNESRVKIKRVVATYNLSREEIEQDSEGMGTLLSRLKIQAIVAYLG